MKPRYQRLSWEQFISLCLDSSSIKEGDGKLELGRQIHPSDVIESQCMELGDTGSCTVIVDGDTYELVISVDKVLR